MVRQEADGTFKYSMSNAAADTSWERLAYMQAQRFWIERCFQDAKSELGMAQYELRGWPGWHHRMALVCLALLFLLMPLATGIADDENTRAYYLDEMIARLERHTGCAGLAAKIDFKKSYCVSDFVRDYNAYKGNAYGLANTLGQTAVLKPSIRNRSLSNLFYAGQLTVPGPGVPPSVISGKIAANELKKLKMIRHEKAV